MMAKVHLVRRKGLLSVPWSILRFDVQRLVLVPGSPSRGLLAIMGSKHAIYFGINMPLAILPIRHKY
jgi:hypothetical protein